MTKDIIKQILRQHKVTQVELAERLSISRQALDDSLNRDMRVSTLERIAEAIGITMGEMYGESNVTSRCPHCGAEIKIKIEG